MCHENPFEDEFDFTEAKCRGVNEQIYFRIQFRNLDEDVIQMLTIQIKVFFTAEIGNHIQEGCEIALWKRTHCHLLGSSLDMYVCIHVRDKGI